MSLLFGKVLCHLSPYRVFSRNELVKTSLISDLRTFLSSAYELDNKSSSFLELSTEAEEMALQTLRLDRCHERDMPVSSLMIDRMIKSIQTKQHLNGSLYYLYKFRHSQNGYHLQPWTTFAFVTKCLRIDPATLLDTLHQRQQYGIFPNEYTMNLVLDHFLKKHDIEGATKTLEQMFLLETLDNKVAQVLAIHTLSEFWKLNCTGDAHIPSFKDLPTKRNLSAALYCIGLYLSNPSLIVIGQSLLGSVELGHGIKALYQDPWGPLSTKPGYLTRVITYVDNLQSPVSQQCVDTLLHCCTANERLQSKAAIACEALKDKNLISNEEKLKLSGIAESLMQNLSQHEEDDIKKFNEILSTWSSNKSLLEELEKEILDEFSKTRAEHFRASIVDEKAHKMAVETLGYWDMAKNKANTETSDQEEKKPIYYIREDYVEGALEDLDLVEKFRKRRSIAKDPVILI